MSGQYFRGGPPNASAPVRAFDGKASVMTTNRLNKEGETMRIHAKTFAAWMNVHLRKKQLRVNDFPQDLTDGILLIQLIEALTGQQCLMNYNKNPRLEIQKVENVAIALQFIGNFTKINVNPKDIVNGDLKVILSVIWRLVINFQVLQGSDSSSHNAAALKREAKAKLLGWVQEKTGEAVHDCDRSFDDGMIYCKLIYAFNPSLINLEQMKGLHPFQRLQMAFDLIENHLLIEKMIFPEDICNNDPTQRPDEQCILTYLSHFPAAFLKLRQTPEYLSPDAVSITAIPTSFPSISSLASNPVNSAASPINKAVSAPRYLVNNNLPSPPSISAVPSPSSAPAFPSPPVSSPSSVPNQGTGVPSPFNSLPSTSSLSNPSVSLQSGFNQAPNSSYSSNLSGNQFPSIPAASNSPIQSFNLPSAPGTQQFNQSLGVNSPNLYNSSLASNPSGTGAPSPAGRLNSVNLGPGNQSLNPNANPYSSGLPSSNPQLPSRPAPSVNDFGSNLNQPSSQSGYPSPVSSQLPQRPPPPSSDFGSSLNSGPQRPPPPVSSFTPMIPVPSNPAPAPPSDYALDLLKKEQELKQKEEELLRQQEEFNRLAAAREEELKKLREQATKDTDDQLQQLQQQLQQQRISGIAKLQLEVKSARNLRPVKVLGSSNPYVLITVDKQKEKTTTINNTIHPTWNESEYKFFLENPNQSVNITIYSKSSIGADDFLGKVEIPIKNIPMGERVTKWYPLQPKKPGAVVSGEIQLVFLLSR